MPLKFFQPRRTSGGVHLTGMAHADDVGEGLRQLVCEGDLLATDIQFSEGGWTSRGRREQSPHFEAGFEVGLVSTS
jgi:hypothetical protein